MTVILTRPVAENTAFAARLERLGLTVVQSPLLGIQALPISAHTPQIDGLVFTSPRAPPLMSRKLDCPVFCIGSATAQAAAAAGFTNIQAHAQGDRAQLVENVRRATRGLVLIAQGEQTRGNLAQELGPPVQVLTVYRAVLQPELNSVAQRALLSGEAIVALFSPRTAQAFRTAVQGIAAPMKLICLSQAVAAEIREIPNAEIFIAATPSADATCELILECAGVKKPLI
jgi:uroporphyrinogen-III synthase